MWAAGLGRHSFSSILSFMSAAFTTLYKEEEKAKMIKDTGLSEKQLIQWFSNNRKRYWKPRMEEMGKYVRMNIFIANLFF
jgi:hypothetical protein